MFVVRHIVILLCVVVTGTWGRRPFFGFGLPPMGPEKASSCPANNLEKLTIIGQNLLPLLGQAGDNWRNIMDPICDCGSHFLWVRTNVWTESTTYLARFGVLCNPKLKYYETNCLVRNTSVFINLCYEQLILD